MTSSKRRQEERDDSDDEEIEVLSDDSRSNSKRARRDESEPRDAGNGDDAMSDDELERLHEEAMARRNAQRAAKVGSDAELGIIQRVDMINFLCHRNVTIHLSPRINFITGHNGSGKSAILTAIAVALGGKATSTGRGTGLKSFIKEGETAGEVTIRMKNEGPDAIDPDIYGDSIIITRHFNISGASGFKIKSSKGVRNGGEGRVVATTKVELQRITDAMNIQVDNPLNVLTQDLSRKFISTSSPQEKYEFFLKGTQLQQLSDDYQLILENITRTKAVLKQKSENIPELKLAHRTAVERFQQATVIVEQHNQVDELMRELAWGYVHEKQKELQVSLDAVATATRHVERIDERLAGSTAKLQTVEAEIQEVESEIAALRTSKEPQKRALEAEAKEAARKMKALEDEKTDLLRDKRRQTEQKDRARTEIRTLSQKIRVEEEKIAQSTNGARALLETSITQQKAQRDAAQQELDQLSQLIAEAEGEEVAKNALRDATQREFNMKNNERGQLQNDIAAIEQGLRDKWAKYGRNIPQVLRQIDATAWRGNKPIGPLGDFVELEQREWEVPVKIAIGNMMSNWLVENSQDRTTLKDILATNGNHSVNILVSKRDMFDYSSGEAPRGVPTVLRAVRIRDPFVERALVNNASIESVCLAQNLKAAEHILNNHRSVQRVLTVDLLRVENHQTLSQPDPAKNNFFRALWTGNEDNARQALQDKRTRIQELARECEDLNREKVELQAEANEASRLVGRRRTQKEQLRRSINGMTTEIDRLEARAKETAPAEVHVFQEARAEQETAVARAEAQEQVIQQRLDDIRVELEPLREAIAGINHRKAALEEVNQAKAKLAADLSVERTEAQNQINGWKTRLNVAKDTLAKAEQDSTTLQDEFTQWNDKAVAQWSPRMEITRPVERVKREREKLQQAITRAERTLGASADELSREVVRTRTILDKAKEETGELETLARGLQTALEIRMTRWHQFRRHISIRAKLIFQHHLAKRGFYGKIIMQHPGEDDSEGQPIKFGTLNLRIKTDEQTVGKGARDKDTKSLSGGEKSFSTLCLLMALWDAIGCPIRCLDEFDVFMDEINRVIAMKMMVEGALSSASRQFVLITPLGTKGVDPSVHVKVHRMVDPERNQTTLPY